MNAGVLMLMKSRARAKRRRWRWLGPLRRAQAPPTSGAAGSACSAAGRDRLAGTLGGRARLYVGSSGARPQWRIFRGRS